MTGLPVTDAIDSAAPPRASPSSLVRTTPSYPTPSRNACAVVTASWPIIASTTKRTSSGSTASRMSAACCISSASTPRRPAVSTMTTSWSLRLASSIDSRATATGSPTPLPGSGAKTGTPTRSPLTWSCWTAFGRCRSAATSIGVLPCSLSQSASLAASVVLPAPWRPASMITVGPDLAYRSRRVSPPRISTSSSLTILTTCWAGFSAPLTSSPRARSLTAPDELLDDRQRDVGLEQRDPDLARGGVDVGLGEPALPAEVLEGVGEAVGESGEQG